MTGGYDLPPFLRFPLVAFYLYGAAVHVASIAGLSGFEWLLAPRKWQILDLAYLAVDLTVVVGLLARKAWGVFCLIAAAISQILLYTLFRRWILNVPAVFEVEPSAVANLNLLMLFHAICLVAVGFFTWRTILRAVWRTERPCKTGF